MATLTLGARARDIALAFMDCDGVIFDSNEAKAQAFLACVADYPEQARQQLAAYHRDNGGMSRYAKLRHFFSEMHPVDDVEGEMTLALARFGEVSEAAYAKLTPRPEAIAFATHFDVAYVVSGADQRELERVFRAQQIAQHFAGVLGSPTQKPAHMEAVLAARTVPPERCVMVGDGRAEFQAARAHGMPFVFLAEMSNWATARQELAGQDDAYIADDWATLSAWLG